METIIDPKDYGLEFFGYLVKDDETKKIYPDIRSLPSAAVTFSAVYKFSRTSKTVTPVPQRFKFMGIGSAIRGTTNFFLRNEDYSPSLFPEMTAPIELWSFT